MSDKKFLSNPLRILNIHLSYLRYFDNYAYFIVLPFIEIQFVSISELLKVTTTLYFIAIGISVFFSGAILEKLGTRKTIFLTLILLLAGSTASAFSFNLFSQTFGRALSGFGIGFLPTLIRVLSYELSDKNMSKVVSYFNFFKNSAPILAILISGLAIAIFGWRSVFYIIFIYLIFELIWISTHTKKIVFHYQDKKISHFKSFKTLVSDGKFMTWIIACGLLASSSILFVLFLSISLSTQFHYTSYEVSLVLCIVYFFAAFSSMLNYYLLKRISEWWVCAIGYSLMAASIILLLAFSNPNFEILYLFSGILFFIGFSIASPIFIAQTAKLSKAISVAWGVSLMTSFFNILNGLNSYLIHYIKIDSALKLGLFLTVLLGLSLIFSLASFFSSPSSSPLDL